MLLKGFHFGMVLQLAIGPMCMFILQTSAAHGFAAGEAGVLATACIDALEISLAIAGVAGLLERNKRAAVAMRIFGVAVLVLYGIVSIASAILGSGATGVSILSSGGLAETFARAIVLTLSDPLTIVFWAGVFSSKIASEHLSKHDVRIFGCGCVTATLSFLTLVALTGSAVQPLISDGAVRILNAVVGVMMFYFAYRDLKRPDSNTDSN